MKNEMNVAEEIVSVLPDGTVARVCSDDRDAIRYAVRSAGHRLREIVLRRSSLRKLIEDPARSVKIEYLQRDLLRSASRRSSYEYPRPNRILAAVRASADRRVPSMLAIASVS
jgi:hypothetical protein